ncbi:MAG: hypothetical protein K2X11_15575 [Acetobacteraceae bacterium]|nr:hypothetical protein [Acetobacteraceae bacterium]
MRAFAGVCVVSTVVGGSIEVFNTASFFMGTRPAVATVLASDEPGGAPEALELNLPLAPQPLRLPRVGIRFTTAAGQTVTTTVPASASRPWAPLTPGTTVIIRYWAGQPESTPELRGTSELATGFTSMLLLFWIGLPGMWRVMRGAPWTLGVFLPPWPFRRSPTPA